MTILMAEDDEGHATLIQRNLRRAGIANEIVHVRDGQEALNYIRSSVDSGGLSRHGSLLVLLDINMPRIDGVETLRHLKGNEKTKNIPIIMLTTTDDPGEVGRCYQLGCNVYITKPVDYERFSEAIRRLGLFLQVVSVPQKQMYSGERLA